VFLSAEYLIVRVFGASGGEVDWPCQKGLSEGEESCEGDDDDAFHCCLC